MDYEALFEIHISYLQQLELDVQYEHWGHQAVLLSLFGNVTGLKYSFIERDT